MDPKGVFGGMLSRYGRQRWWPVTDSRKISPSYKKRKSLSEKQRLEICLGAILAQNTDWKNVMKALENLNKAGMIDCKKISKARHSKLAKLIRSSGYYNMKAKKLKAFCKHVEENYNCELNKMLSKPLQELRFELLSLYGIGQETADDIILYAAEKPTFVVDAYTMRFAERFFGKPSLNYVEVKRFFESQLPASVQLFNEFHALLVAHGKRYCKKKPLCRECFLCKECGFPKQK